MIKRALPNCKMCKKEIKGREGKLYCSIKCKSIYHRKFNQVTKIATNAVDKILHSVWSEIDPFC